MRAHDVRRLRFCSYCCQPGLPEDLLDIPAGLLHGRCVLATLGEAALFALPPEQLGKLTLADVGMRLMKRLVEAQDRSASLVPGARGGAGGLHP